MNVLVDPTNPPDVEQFRRQLATQAGVPLDMITAGFCGTQRPATEAEVAAGPQGADGDATVVEIDGVGVQELRVRFARPGDRFHALGAPGHKPVRRFLGEAGVPREERGLVPIVLAGEEVVWVAGVAVSERHKVTDPSRRRIRLSLVGAKGGSVR